MTCIIPLVRLLIEDWLTTFDVRTARRIRNRMIFAGGFLAGVFFVCLILLLAGALNRAGA